MGPTPHLQCLRLPPRTSAERLSRSSPRAQTPLPRRHSEAARQRIRRPAKTHQQGQGVSKHLADWRKVPVALTATVPPDLAHGLVDPPCAKLPSVPAPRDITLALLIPAPPRFPEALVGLASP